MISKIYLSIMQQKVMDREAIEQIEKNRRKEGQEKQNMKNIYNIDSN
jgi:hypothetical protein